MNSKTKLFSEVYQFGSIKEALAKANEEKSGDKLAGVAVENALERVAAEEVLSQLTITDLRNNPAVDYDEDEVTRVIQDAVNEKIYNEIKSRTIADLCEYTIDLNTGDPELKRISRRSTSEAIAGVTKLMSSMDLTYVAKKLEITVTCNTIIGKKGTLAARLQPNHTTDDIEGIGLSLYEGLAYGTGDVILGSNPVDDSIDSVSRTYNLFHKVKNKWEIPTQACVLTHVTTVMECIKRGVSADSVFQSTAGSQKGDEAFGFNDKIIEEAHEFTLEEGTAFGPNVMYLGTEQGSELPSDAHHGTNQSVMEARCYGCVKKCNPYLINTVVGSIGPEYLYNSKQIIRAGLENHFMGKLTGISMDVDIYHTNHMKTDVNDLEVLATLLGAAEVNYAIGVPGGDDIMLNHRTPSYQDDAALRVLFNRRSIEEFEEWMEKMGLIENGRYTERFGDASIFLGK